MTVATVIGVMLTALVYLIDLMIGRAPGGELMLGIMPIACVCGYTIMKDWFADLPELLGYTTKKMAKQLPTDLKASPHFGKQKKKSTEYIGVVERSK